MKTTDTHVNSQASMLRQRWLKTESTNLNNKTSIEDMRSSFSTRPSKERNVNRLTSSNTKSSISSGTRISFRLRKKMPKPLVNLKIDIPKRLKRIDKFWKRSFHLLSNSALNS